MWSPFADDGDESEEEEEEEASSDEDDESEDIEVCLQACTLPDWAQSTDHVPSSQTASWHESVSVHVCVHAHICIYVLGLHAHASALWHPANFESVHEDQCTWYCKVPSMSLLPSLSYSLNSNVRPLNGRSRLEEVSPTTRAHC